jgi:DNA-binding response OmpR family regulator
MHRKKILLVDDSSTILMMEKFILRNDPFLLLAASSGEEAVQKASAEKPDLILLATNMPRMSGVEAWRVMRAMDELAHVPVLFVTPGGECTHVTSEWEDGCTDFVTKPINAIELLAKVRQLLEHCPS